MATLATLYDRLMGKGGAREDARAQWADIRPSRAIDSRLRPFPNEDVAFHVKRIDNSRVIREADPQTPKLCWKMIGGASASAVLLIGMLLPGGYRLMAGYQIEELKKEHNKLESVKAEMELEEAKLLSPERLAELARLQEFVDPEPGRVVHLPEKASTAIAMRREVNPLPIVVSEPEAPAEPSEETQQ